MAAQRLFADHIASVFEQFDADRNMIRTAGSVDEKIDIGIFDHFPVVIVFLELRGRSDAVEFPPFGNGIGYGNDFITLPQRFLGFKQMAVDVASAPALSDNSDSDSFHVLFSR